MNEKPVFQDLLASVERRRAGREPDPPRFDLLTRGPVDQMPPDTYVALFSRPDAAPYRR